MDQTRRRFLKTAAMLAAASPLSVVARMVNDPSDGAFTPRTHKASVVIARRPSVIHDNGDIDHGVLASMIASSLCHMTGTSSVAEAWRSIVKPSEIIGIKVNAMGGRPIATHQTLVAIVARQLIAVGVPEKNIIIWDRLTAELERAGYTISRSNTGIRCFGTDTEYEPQIETAGSVGTCFSRIITQCDALINIPVLKDHDLSGVSLGLKNFYGAIHNPNKYHDNGCDPFIADLNTHPYIKQKLRLTIIDGLRAQYNGGPAYKQQWQWPYGGIIVSRDPVAADAVGTACIEEKRKEQGLPSLAQAGRPPLHIKTASARGLGCDDLNKITILRV
ncbi:MAG: DUF362 domain-containing protein [Desulfobacterota bacterium]|nr:DUF362 domain-containing protein [Thermodesulfobacteriota bacterium]